MRFLLYVEGHTEHKAIAGFLKRWLDPRLPYAVRVEPVRFNGFGDYLSEARARVPRDLNKAGSDVIAVIGLLDFYRLALPYPKKASLVEERCRWAEDYIKIEVSHAKFQQYFAVHEIETWLLSDTSIFPSEIRNDLSSKSANPEQVNGQEPPSDLLERLYRTKTGKAYRKAIHGPALFANLSPDVAYGKCPNLKAMLDEMLRLAQDAVP